MPEEMFEDEAMAEVTPPALVRVTGSTGIDPLIDGQMRGYIVALPGLVVGFTNLRWNWLSEDELSVLIMILLPLGPILWALFDKFIKGRLLSS